MSVAYVMELVFGQGFEFWKRNTEQQFKWAARELLAKGFTTDEAAEILGALWSAASDEYGA